MSKPFFSIVIPTYNRATDLKIAMSSVLKQDFDNYEIIVSDNASTDTTEKICKSFNDERIKYSRNKTNIGFNRNLYKGIKSAHGQYIFMLGDDDFILKMNTLTNVFKRISNNKYGVVRLKFIYQDNHKNLFSIYFIDNQYLDFEKNGDNVELLEFLYNKAIFSFISGLIFKNIENIKVAEIESAKNSILEISNFWIAFVFPAAKSYGVFIDLDYPIIANWSIYSNPEFYLVKDGKIPDEKIWKLLSKHLSKKEMMIWKERETNKMTLLLPSIKYYSNNQNLLFFAKRILEINKALYKNWFFYFSFLTALFMPKFIWRFFRKIYHARKTINNK
ncbi:MAG: glycosyltransferase family 2 protein [Patescibacteria group bacterium]